MKKHIRIVIFICILTLSMSGCGKNAGKASRYSKEDLQRLTQIEIFDGNGELINTITDTETLNLFNQLDMTGPSAYDGAQQTGLNETPDSDVLYTIVAYKTPAAVFHNGTLEKMTEITVFENTNVIKEQIAPEIIKGFSVSEEDLTFQVTVSDADMEFLLSLAEK